MNAVFSTSMRASLSAFRNGRIVPGLVSACGPFPLKGHEFTTARVNLNQQAFEEAKTRLNSLKEKPDNRTMLNIYALFKQATVGENNTKKPGMMDFVGKAKWEAWTGLGSMSKEAAQNEYVLLVDSLVSEQPPESSEKSESPSSGKYETLNAENKNGIYRITLNRPNKKNAITIKMYNEWAAALKEADEDPKVVLACITGAGDMYCSGNDLNNFMGIDPKDMAQLAKDSGVLLENFVAAFINFSKPLIGVVNGPAVGVAVTTMGLFDIVYATDKATFHTPFTALGQSAEGCSSYTFPKILGPLKAAEMLLFNKKYSATQMCELGFVTEVFPDHSFQSEVWQRIDQYSKLPKGSLRYGKMLIRENDKETLLKVNKAECERLIERWQSDECIQAIMSFFSKQ